MKHILKLYEGLGIRLKRNSFHKATLLLTFKYSVLIFLLLFFVSILIYIVFSLKLGLTVGDGPLAGLFAEGGRSHEESESLFEALITVNMTVWLLASVLSYFLARNTLRPIEEIHKKQEDFVADVAHELRTPLAVMKTGAETVLRAERSCKAYKEFINESLEEIEHITIISNDLLTLLKYKNTQYESKVSLDLSEMVQVQTKRFKEYALAKNVSLTENIQADVFVKGIANDLERLLLNLIKNAVDYNKDHGSVHIALSQDDDCVVLAVSDTGIGMNEVDLVHAFDRFYKADIARARLVNVGSGLGLSIVKEIVDSHDGSIKIDSVVDEGSVFTITLPCV